MTIYTVKSGDSLYSVAREFGVPPSRIISDNFLTDPGALVVGQELVILYPNQTHTVRGGETLFSIANQYGKSLIELYRNNPFLDGSPTVFPGQVLNISYDTPPLGEISVNGYVYPSVDLTVLRRTLPYLTYISVFTYGIRDNGELIAPAADDSEIIAMAKEYKTVPLMMLTSLNSEGKFSNELAAKILSDEVLSENLARSAVGVMRERGYGGIDVDFEYVPGEYAEAYGKFIGMLRRYAGENVPVFVSLAPKYSSDMTGLLYAGHDYSLLGAAADHLLLMTYEWGYTYGPPMAVSPVNEVRSVVEYAISEIPSEKLYLGIPNYGYDWKLPYVRGESRARSLSNTEAVELAGEKYAEIRFDERSQAPTFNYFDRPEIYADATQHEVWFENASSYDSLLRLISEYSLSGCGIWNVMRYCPAIWLVLNSLFKIKKSE